MGNGWNNVKKGRDEASIFLKVGAGESVHMHLLTEPMAFSNLYFNEAPYKDAPKSFNLPFGTQLPGFKPRVQYAFEVVITKGENLGKHKLFVCGQGIADDISKAAFEWGDGEPDLSKADVVISREGSGLETRWTATTKPTSYQGDKTPLIDMDIEIPMADQKSLSQLQATVRPASGMEKGNKGKGSNKQVEYILDLKTKCGFTQAEFEDLLKSKTGKIDLYRLTTDESSAVIEALKAVTPA